MSSRASGYRFDRVPVRGAAPIQSPPAHKRNALPRAPHACESEWNTPARQGSHRAPTPPRSPLAKLAETGNGGRAVVIRLPYADQPALLQTAGSRSACGVPRQKAARACLGFLSRKKEKTFHDDHLQALAPAVHRARTVSSCLRKWRSELVTRRFGVGGESWGKPRWLGRSRPGRRAGRRDQHAVRRRYAGIVRFADGALRHGRSLGNRRGPGWRGECHRWSSTHGGRLGDCRRDLRGGSIRSLGRRRECGPRRWVE